MNVIEITKICEAIGTPPPKVVEYANCVAVSFRNGDGLKTLVTFDSDATAEQIRAKIATAFKIKGCNAASEEKIAAITKRPSIGEWTKAPALLDIGDITEPPNEVMLVREHLKKRDEKIAEITNPAFDIKLDIETLDRLELDVPVLRAWLQNTLTGPDGVVYSAPSLSAEQLAKIAEARAVVSDIVRGTTTMPDDPVTPAADIRKHQEAKKLNALKPPEHDDGAE